MATLRTLATVAIIVTLYYLVPMDQPIDAPTVVVLILVALALCAIVAWQIRAIGRSQYPNARAAEAFACSLPLYLLLFAATYFLMARSRPTTFGAPLTRTDAMYFSSTIFTTVGFGDITAKTEAARILVTVQMMLDLVVIGLVVRLVLNAIKVSQSKRLTGD
jgi:voltage-gated potassium channel